jgi:hypothetical protein
MQGYDTSLIYLNWIQVYQLAIDTILFYDIQVKEIILLLLTYMYLLIVSVKWYQLPIDKPVSSLNILERCHIPAWILLIILNRL